MTIRKRISIFMVGLTLLALGIALMVKADLGTAPWDSVFVGFERTFGLTVGLWAIIVQVTLMCINAIISRSLPMVTSVLPILIKGAILDFWLIYIFSHFEVPSDAYLLKVTLYFGGLLCMGVGLGVYILSKLPPAPLDLLVMLLHTEIKMKPIQARTSVEFFALCLGFVLGGTIGVGTVIFVFSIGYIIQYSNKKVGTWLNVL